MENTRWKYSSTFTWTTILVLTIQTIFSEAAVILNEPESLSIPDGYVADIMFNCRARDELTNPTYTWFKNGIALDIDSEDRYSLYTGDLSISRPQRSDAGEYRCVIRSDEGTVSTNSAELSFKYLIQPVVVPSTPVVASQGSGVKLECEAVEHSPDFSIYFTWDRTGDYSRIPPLGSKTHFISQKTGNMYLANPQPGDSGEYQCAAFSLWELNNVKESINANSVDLQVNKAIADYAPKLMVTPEDVTYVTLGGATFIECFASGNPTPDLTWMKDGSEELPDSAKISPAGQIYFTDVGQDAEGTYTCTATNNQGSVSANGKLVLNYVPEWSSEIESISSDRASTVSWDCSANAVPAAIYEWRKNGEVILPEDNSTMSIQEEDGYSTLTIEDLGMNDAGIYQCVATNSLGEAVSAAKLVVNSYAPVIDPQVASLTYGGLGRDATIECNHTAAPAAQITWEKDDVPLQTGTKYQISGTAALTITGIEKEDEGDYTCKLSNLLGEAESFGRLRAYESTEITEDPEDAYTREGETISLECDSTHDMALPMKWIWKHEKKGITIYDTKYKTEGGKLMIDSVTSKESGTYTCCAETKVNTPCASAYVYVTAPPNRPEDVIVTSSSATFQVLKWTAPFDNHSPIQSYSIEYKNSYDEEWQKAKTEPSEINVTRCSVFELNPHNGYRYRVYATNKLGTSEPSEESPIQSTSKGAPSKAPRRIGGGGGNIGDLVVTWKPLPEEYYGEDRINYVIAIQKIPEGGPSHLPLPIPDKNSTVDEEADDEDDWKLKTVDGFSTNHTFSVDEDEVWTPYNVKIRATNTIGDGPWSRIRIVHTFEIKPDTAPSNLRFGKDKAQSTVAQLEWDSLYSKNGRVAGYAVRIVPKAGPDAKEMRKNTKTMSTITKVTGLSSNTVYDAAVAGFNGAGQGPWSAPFTFNTAKNPPSVAPKEVKVSIKNFVITAKWNPIIYEQQPLDEEVLLGYKFQYWWSNKTSAVARTVTTTENSIQVTVANNSRYNVWVRGYSAGGNGVPSAVSQVSTESTLAAGYIQCCGANAVKFNSVIIMAVTLLWMLFIKLEL